MQDSQPKNEEKKHEQIDGKKDQFMDKQNDDGDEYASTWMVG